MGRKLPLIGLSLLIVFVAFFTLIMIFDNINKLSEKCKIQFTEECKKFSPSSTTILIIVLIIAGLFFIVIFISYLLIFLKI